MQDPMNSTPTGTQEHPAHPAEPTRDQLEAHLRDSIVGRYIKRYNTRLRLLNQALNELRQQIEDKLTAVDQRISNEIAEVRTDMRGLTTKLGNGDSGVTLDKIEGLIDAKLDARLDTITVRGEADLQKLSTLINDFVNKFQAQIDRLSTDVNLLQEQSRRNQESLRGELISETEALESTKVDRLTLAETLIMLGMKLKDNDLLGEYGIDLDFEDDFEDGFTDDFEENGDAHDAGERHDAG